MSRSNLHKSVRRFEKASRRSSNRWSRRRHVVDLAERAALNMKNAGRRESRYPWCAIEATLVDALLGLPSGCRDFPAVEGGEHRIVMSVTLDPYSRAILNWDFRVVYLSTLKGTGAREVDHGV